MGSFTASTEGVIMGLTTTAAYLKLCPNCGNHGRIVFSNKKESDEFTCPVEAYASVTVALATGNVTEPEASHLREEIRSWEPAPLALRVRSEGLGLVVHDAEDLEGPHEAPAQEAPRFLH